jgi:acyl-CoA reductase-like NAD-dependent aldehyde dehydrogenase
LTSTTFTDVDRLLIGGERVGAADGGTIDVLNPSNGKIIGRIPRCTAVDVERAVSAASAAFPAWSQANPLERARCLNALADAVDARAEELLAIDSLDNGSPLRVMRRDVYAASELLRYFAGLVLHVRGETIPSDHERLIYSLRQPFGVVARIGAFNHPFLFTVGKMAAALAAGNTVISKPSEHTSLSSLAVADDIREIFPAGVVNILTGYGNEVGDAIVTHPEIRRIGFVGAADTGRAIQARAAQRSLKTVTLELGGKNPIVIFPDADIDAAVEGALQGMNFTWQGQSCGSTSRLLVHHDIHEELVDRLAVRIAALRSGLPDDPSTDTGAIVNQAQLDKVLSYVQIGQDEGATLVTGGTRVSNGALIDGLFVLPALFDNVDPYGRLAQEEIFGPVLATIAFDDYEDAIKVANSVRYGLTASIFTRNLELAHRFARDVQAGYVWVNETSVHLPGTSFGGFKDSGVGREESLEELTSYTQVKNVSVRFG